MLWEKKPVVADRQAPAPAVVPPAAKPEVAPAVKPYEENVMAETIKPAGNTPSDTGRTQWGRSLVVKGDVSGNEDLTIFGQFEGTINLQGHSLTIGPEGKVKAEIQAARVVIHGTVHGNITVKERVEIYKTGHVVGDLMAPGISIEDGAYFKGKIEILRDNVREPEAFSTSANKPRLTVASPGAAS
jgi:cytoskeletal protein CcmA (bactofilin family)